MALSKASKRENQGSIEIMGAPGAQRRVQATIAPEVMGLIIDRLTDAYTRPVEATVREVISNAIDTTERAAAAGQGEARPVEVTSPTMAKGMFVVKDHGQGMTADEVEEVFSQYGNSTKRDDMTQTGAYGLGAKAPLAYCTEFRGVTIKGGVKTTFSMKREDLGTFSEIHSEEKTTLPNGTTIYVPVAAGDIQKFADAIAVYQNYSLISPVVVDGSIAPIDGFTILADDLLLDAESNTRTRVWIRKTRIRTLIATRMGGSSDHINTAYLLSGWLYEPDSSNRWRRGEPDVVIELKPGLVDFTTSRDEITENSRYETLAALVKTFVLERNENSVAEAFRALEALTPDDRRNVLRGLMSSVHAADPGRFAYDIAVINRHSDAGYPVELFDDGDKNLLRSIMAHHAKNASTGFVIAERKTITVAARSLDETRTRVITGASVNLRQVEAIAAVKKDVAGAATTSVASHILEQPMVLPNVMKIVLLKDCSDEDAAKLIRGRRELAAMGYDEALFIPVRNVKTIDKQVELATAHTDTPVVVTTAGELLAALRALRAAERKAKAPEGVPGLYGRIIDGRELATDAEVVAANWSYGHTVTVDEILSGKWLVLFANGLENATLIGASNAGIKLAGHRILHLTARDVRAPHFKALAAKRTRLLTNEEFRRSSAAATTALENRDFYGQVLNTELEALSLDEYMTGVARYSRVRVPVLRFLLDVAKAEKPADKELTKLLKAAMNRDGKMNGRVMSFTQEHLEQAFGVETAARLKVFQAFLQGRLGSTLEMDDDEASAIQGLSFSYSEKIAPSPIVRAIGERIIESL